jgi:ribonuclease HI
MAIGTAFELLIKELKELDDLPWFDVEILSDSRYAIGCMTEWAYKWKSNGWRNAAGAPIANQKLIKQVLGFDDAFSEIADITYTWIPRSENKMADRLCNQALDEQEEVQRKKEAARRANQEAAQRAEASARRSREDEARRVKEEAARRARVEALRIAREEAEERTREEAEERRPSIRIHSNRAVPFGHTNTPHDETVSVDFFMSSLSFGP